MTASEHTHRQSATGQVTRRAAAVVRRIHHVQALMWQRWRQANRAADTGAGLLCWVLTFDGYRLTGSRQATPHHADAGCAA